MWWLLQVAIICGMVYLVDDPKLTGAAVIFGLLISLFVTGLSSRLIDWFRVRGAPREHREPGGDRLRLPRSGRHSGNSPKLSDRRRIGKNVRKII